MGDGMWALSAPGCGLALIEEAVSLLIGRSFSPTGCRYLWRREDFSFTVKGCGTDRGDLLFCAFITIKRIYRRGSFGLGNSIMGLEKGHKQFFGGRVHAGLAVSSLGRFVQEAKISTSIGRFCLSKCLEPFLDTSGGDRDRLSLDIGQHGSESPIRSLN